MLLDRKHQALPFTNSVNYFCFDNLLLPECWLAITESILNQIEWCWSEKVYLAALRHRFWKLTLQLVNVFAHALENLSHYTPTNEQVKLLVRCCTCLSQLISQIMVCIIIPSISYRGVISVD